MSDLIRPEDVREIETMYREMRIGPPVFREPVRCRLGFHRWSKWWQPREGNILGQQNQAVGFYRDLERACLSCRCIQGKQVRWIA